MGSKKLKRKKLKCKKLEKCHKPKAIKRKKTNVTCKEADNGEILHEKTITCNRLSKKNYSFSYGEDDFLEIKYFSKVCIKVREDYFKYLQTVISDNCVYYGSAVTEEMLENLALELEKNALLACLQINIYKKSMSKIISDIKKSTEEKQVHKEVRKLLPESNCQVKCEKTPESSPIPETCSRIPTINSTRTDDNLIDNGNFWAEESVYNSDPYYLENYNENVQPWVDTGSYLVVPNSWNDEVHNEVNNSQFVDQISPVQNTLDNSHIEDKSTHEECLDPLLVSRTQLKNLVEQTLNETEKVSKQRRDEQERAYIAHILEGDESLDERLNDSLSDNECEFKENIDESNLMDRLEKMKEIFGVEEEESQTSVIKKQKPTVKPDHTSNRSRRPTIWKYEKFIHLHKYSLIAAEMTYERRKANQEIFLELFGEDSDDEHQLEYSSQEKYKICCSERISSWVVKYLMPFYHEKRILGRTVFKTLGHYISDTIVDTIQYPDEWTVKYFVSKFFPPKKKYVCDADVLNFQLD